MKLLTLKQTTLHGTDEVFVPMSPTGAAVAAFVFAMLTIAAAYLTLAGHVGSFDPPRLLSGVIGAFFLLFTWALFNRWRAAHRPTTNWILRIRGSQVLIKFRSFENWKMSEDDVQVIELNRDEIAYVSKSTERQVTSDMSDHGVTAETRIELEIGLNDKDTGTLEAALAEERTRPGWGGEHMQAKALDYPVSAENGVIRITWKNQSTIVKPKIDQALARLGKIAKVAEAQKREGDFTVSALKKLSEPEQKAKLAELARRNSMAAITTARQVYGCSLAEAKEMIESLNAS